MATSTHNPYVKHYQTSQVQTASREQILIMLYDGAIKFLNQAKSGMAEGNVEKFHNNLIKTQRIIMELMTTLDFEVGGEIAENLFKLYEYFHYQLVQANVKKDATMIDEVQQHLRDLKGTWEQAIMIAKTQLQELDATMTDPVDALPEEPAARAYSA